MVIICQWDVYIYGWTYWCQEEEKEKTLLLRCIQFCYLNIPLTSSQNMHVWPPYENSNSYREFFSKDDRIKCIPGNANGTDVKTKIKKLNIKVNLTELNGVWQTLRNK